ncbi:TIGR03016 family PEP-CTERM system-associated outer membrane protein [Thalassotalea crassostreae]|uniref:TIGR03016 family PEP-CTERM system-associated outer membrane protein n=1 Tax=Thalassotalea crassostreae TaxID=1763536 RepID=UPI0008396D04|nr:TIGR03016 family PEP-CTERM system-associated outer membrane protein [Thalassotalea crassostreae]
MVITVTAMVLKLSSRLACCALILTCWSSSASELVITPRVGIEAIHTDNVTLAENDKESSLVSMVKPGINLTFVGARANLELDYEYSKAYYSHDHDLDNHFNELAMSSSLELKPKGLSIFAQGSIRNVSRNTARNSIADIVSGDTVEFKSVNTGLAYNTRSSAFIIDSTIAYSKSSADDGIGNREGYVANLKSQNGRSADVIFWDINGNYSDYESDQNTGRFYTAEAIVGWITSYKINPFIRYYDEDTSGNLQTQNIQGTSSIGAGVRWLASKHLQLEVAYNAVDEESEAIGDVSAKQEDYYSASVKWQPSSRSSLDARYYQRFFGEAYQLNATHGSKRITSTATYNESLDVFDRFELVPSELQEVWCLADDITNIDQCLLAPGENTNLDDYLLVGEVEVLTPEQADYFVLNKQFNFTSTLALKRTDYSISFGKQKRENLDLESYDEYESARFNISRKTSKVSELSIYAAINKNNLGNGNPQSISQIDYYHSYGASFEQNLNRSLVITYSLLHLNRNSNRLDYNYEENRLSLSLVKNF